MAFVVASELQSIPTKSVRGPFSYARGCVLRDEANVLRSFVNKAFFVLRSMRTDAIVWFIRSFEKLSLLWKSSIPSWLLAARDGLQECTLILTISIARLYGYDSAEVRTYTAW